MAEKRGKREKLVNPATGRTVYADGPAGRCVKALEALARRLGGKASPPKKGILKAPKTSSQRAMLRVRKWTRLENAPKTSSNEKALAIARGNRLSGFASPKNAFLDAINSPYIKQHRWKMSGEAKKKALELQKESSAATKREVPKGVKRGPEWWWSGKKVKLPAKVKWYEKSGPDPLVADGWQVRKDAPVKGVRTLRGGKARSKESAERRRVEGGRLVGKTKYVESLQHEFDRFSPGGLWYPTPRGDKVVYKRVPGDIPSPPPRVRKPKPARIGSF